MKVDILYSGSRGNCTLVRDGETEILIDCGKSLRALTRSLSALGTSPDRISAVFVTHEHSDHTSALDALTSKYKIPVHIETRCAPCLFRSENVAASAVCHDGDFTVRTGSFTVSSFPLPHDSASCVGYVVRSDEGDVFGPTWQKGQTEFVLTPSLGKSLYPKHGDAPKDFEMAFAEDIDGHWNIEFRLVPGTLDLRKAERVLMDFSFCDAAPDGTLEAVWNWSDELGEAETDSASWTYVNLKKTASGTSGEGYATEEEAAASINRTPVYPIKFVSGTNGNHNEGAGNIWDRNVGTKFCTSEFSMKSVVRMKGPTVIDGLIMATANDNSAYNGRNPNEWKIQGSNNAEDWEDIVTGDETFFDEVDFTYFAMRVESTKAYRFFRFYNRSCKSGCCQLSEVVLCSTDDEIKALDFAEVEVEPVDKTKLVNYETPERLAALVPPEPDPEPAKTPAPSAPALNGGDAQKKSEPGALPGVIAAGILVLGLAAAAVIIPKTHKED